jgi:hypothetical protein
MPAKPKQNQAKAKQIKRLTEVQSKLDSLADKMLDGVDVDPHQFQNEIVHQAVVFASTLTEKAIFAIEEMEEPSEEEES